MAGWDDKERMIEEYIEILYELCAVQPAKQLSYMTLMNEVPAHSARRGRDSYMERKALEAAADIVFKRGHMYYHNFDGMYAMTFISLTSEGLAYVREATGV